MYFRCHSRTIPGLASLLLICLVLPGCRREQRTLRDEPPQRAIFVAAREDPISPGGPVPQVKIPSPDEGNAYAISQGQQLFNWYNCSGCHFQGGGGIGPPLMDRPLKYGDAPDNVYDTIVKGRPEGMPSWGGRIPENQIWQIVAYVRSLSGAEPSSATPGRSDLLEKKTTAQLK